MALTSYGAHNLVIVQDYSFKFNEVVCGEPEVYVEIQPEDSEDEDVLKLVTWWHGVVVETASWKYVGMDYATAQSCASQMRLLLEHLKYEWQYGVYLDNGVVKHGWYKGLSTPTTESEVTIVKNGNGAMYDVNVNAQMENDVYGDTPGLNLTGSRPLADQLGNLAGWNTSVTPSNGQYFTSASADNISLVSAPSWRREFELVGVNYSLAIPDEQSPSGYSFPNWYKARTTYQCTVKFEGMTRAACRNLFNSMNTTSGWWYAYHPYEYTVQTTQGGGVGFTWVQNMSKTCYQCLNEFKAYPSDGHLWTAEVHLTQWQDTYTMNPNDYFTPHWPTEWSRVPGLTAFL